MGCLFIILAFFLPRVLMFFIWIGTDWFKLAFHTMLWPALGFFFMPYTTLVWMMAMLNNGHQMSGFWIVLLIVGVVFDLSGHGSLTRRRR